MKFWGYQRFNYSGMFWIQTVVDGQEDAALVYQKDINFAFASDPSTPRQVILCEEPIPTLSAITMVKDRYGNYIMPGAEWTITSVEPMIDPSGEVALYRHLAAIKRPSDFGYPVQRSTA